MSEIEHLLTSVNTWKSGGEVAIHKPLLLLYAIGRYRRGEQRLMLYTTVDVNVNALVQKLRLGKTPFRTNFPFWRLQNDGIWEVEKAELVQTTSQGDAYITDLREHRIKGGLTETIYFSLLGNPSLFANVADAILKKFFPIKVHDELLYSVGLEKKVS